MKTKFKHAKTVKPVLCVLLVLALLLAGCANGGNQGMKKETLLANVDDRGEYVTPEPTQAPEEEEESSSGEESTAASSSEEEAEDSKTANEAEVVRASSRNYSGYTVVRMNAAYSTSELHQPDGTDNSAKMAVDGNEITSWQEGVDGYGEGESVWFTFDKTYNVRYMCIKTGNWRTPQIYSENTRPKELSVWLDGECFRVTIPDGQTEYCIDFQKAVSASQLTVTIDSVYKNAMWDDTCISEITLYANN